MTIINVENLGKLYKLGEKKEERYDTFRNMLTRNLRQGLRQLSGSSPPPKTQDFWALRNVSFAVKEGQRVGVIGRNGAGKSTLLKLLSRITEPTEGRITMKGRVGSLLEVGTGFHPELTGRENIYLNGAVLGMTHSEIRKKFDEIVEFSGVSAFLDTPVKRYSSGMYVRLAFAVAAHLEPDVLIIDEVLAVGDAAFQKKCMGKMDEVGRSGRTLLFVSHSMAAITQLCDSCILLRDGHIAFYGDSNEAARLYLREAEAEQGVGKALWENKEDLFHKPAFTLRSLSLTDAEGKVIEGPVANNDEVWVRIEGDVEKPDDGLTMGYLLTGADGAALYWSFSTDMAKDKWATLKPGRVVLRSRIPPRFVNEGTYTVAALGGLYCREWFFEPGRRVPSVNLTISGGLSDSPYWTARRPTLLAPVIDWITEQ